MSDEKAPTKTGRKARSLEEEIQKAAEKLRRLQDQQREQQRKERERNQKAVLELIKAERLDAVPAEQWRDALPKIKALLIVESAKPAEPAKPVHAASEGAVTAEASQ
jgi:hypothetical protein